MAQSMGYALCVHGSMERDLDIALIPWVESAEPAELVIAAIKRSCRGFLYPRGYDAEYEDKPHGRRAWSFYLDYAGFNTREGPYLDISVMPLQPKQPKG